MRSLLTVFCLLLFATQTQSQQNTKPQLEQKLIEAVKADNLILAKKLLGEGANPDAQDKNDNTALLFAIGRGNDKMVQLLLSKGANPNKTGKDEQVPICVAAFGGHPLIVSALLSKGASAKAEHLQKHTALMMATSGAFAISLPKDLRNKYLSDDEEDDDDAINFSSPRFLNPSPKAHLEVVQILISHGAEVNAVAECDYGETALTWAVQSSDIALVRELLSHGAQPTHGEIDLLIEFEREIENIKKVKLPALSKSQQAGLIWLQQTSSARREIKDLLKSAGAKQKEQNNNKTSSEELAKEIADDVFKETIEDNDLKEFVRLVNAYIQDDKYKIILNSVLRSATIYDRHKMVEFLISKGVDVNWADRHGWTPLMYAAHHGDVEMVEILLNAGADVNKASAEGRTALFYAKGQGKERAKIVELLKTKGAVENPK